MDVDEIKKLVGTNKLVVGSEEVKKNLKRGVVAKIFYATNISRLVEADLRRLSEISNVRTEQLDMPNEELGLACRKPFPVSVIAVKK